jgi:predicted membrane channel-forming protein YqfA (hemolysin III family)
MNHKYKIAGTILALLMTSTTAFANHGLDGLGEALFILFIITGVILAITVIAFIIAARNISRKNKKRRVVSLVMSIPLLLLTFAALTEFPPLGFVFALFLMALWMMIYKSFGPARENVTPGDME